MAKKIKKKKNKKELEKERQRRKLIAIFSVAGAIVLAISILLVIVLLTQNNGGENKKSSVVSGNGNSTSSSSSVSSDSQASDTGLKTTSNLDPTLTYYADINIRDYGTIKVKLDQEAAPITVDNFVNLANSGFYNELTFHRIIKDFMMQGGDPTGTGNGGSGTNIKGEFTANGVNNPLLHTRGAISMARSTPMDSASSQFFIVQKDKEHLDGNYACFGYVTEGMDIVDKICDETPTIAGSDGSVEEGNRPVIDSIVITTEKTEDKSPAA